MKTLIVLLILAAPAVAQFGSNAHKLQGRAICGDAPINTNVVAWDAARSCWAPASAGSGTSAVVATFDTAAGTCTASGGATCTASSTLGTGGKPGVSITDNYGTDNKLIFCKHLLSSTQYVFGGLSYTVAVQDQATTTNTTVGTFSLDASGTCTVWIAGAQGATGTPTIAFGSTALGTAAIASTACATTIIASAPGVLTTDVLNWIPNADISAITGFAPATSGGLSLYIWITAGNVNFKVCNPTASSITPGAVVTLNWRVIR